MLQLIQVLKVNLVILLSGHNKLVVSKLYLNIRSVTEQMHCPERPPDVRYRGEITYNSKFETALALNIK